jgi:GH18 family chitinase
VNGGLGSFPNITDFNAYRTEYPNVKRLFSVAGTGADGPFKNVAESEEIRAKFAENVLKAIEENDFNGGKIFLSVLTI